MIAKEIAAPRTGGSFRDLVSYLTSSQSKEERGGAIRLTNCVSADAESAVLEVENTQARNRRARHTTYHLMLAFPAGEEPSARKLEEVERRACEALGFAEHQRLSVVHHDTDHLHVHVAINRIHPTTAKVNSPSFSKLVLDRVCFELETEYGLQPTRHLARARQAERANPEMSAAPKRRPPDMERISGLESLIGFIQRECADDLRAARSWAEVHEVAAAHGLRARLHGNGLVFVAADGTTAVKASSVSRDLSKAALERSLGPFEGAVAGTIKARAHYRKRPLQGGAAASLYEQFRRECAAKACGVGATALQADAQQARDRERLLRSSYRRWAAIRLVAKGRVAWMLWSAYARRADRRERAHSRHRSRVRRRAVAAQKPRWLEWLRDRAAQGDASAIATLRARRVSRPGANAMSVWGKARPDSVPATRAESATPMGTLIHRVHGGSIRDDGDRLHLTRSASSDAAAEALVQLAYARFGSRIGVDGDDAFRARLQRAAAAMSLPITFESRVERRSIDLRQEEPRAVAPRARGRSR